MEIGMNDTNVHIEAWKSRLLDLGKRNRLMNYKDTKRSNIKINSPKPGILYKKLVINENTLAFSYLSYKEGLGDEERETSELLISGDIETDRPIQEQQKTLANLRYKAKTAIEEQGVNILFLSFGFLHWKEHDASNQFLVSPLVLVPVIITLESIFSPFKIQLHEDEIVVNPTLSFKLENDFNIMIPEFDAYENDIENYFWNIKRMVAPRQWRITPDIRLGLFSFLKMNMYMDIDNNLDKVQSHAVIKALTGDDSLIPVIPSELDNMDHDNQTSPVDIFQVLDADSSQQDAIMYAKRGVSFILQGPPGTGKSQTITNIIAESLAEGKKVLFVSEKMAALDVVYNRLQQVNLSDFCLILHSHRANKKEIIGELGRVLYKQKSKLQGEAFRSLELLKRTRHTLNQYDKELHTQCFPLGKSIYEVNGLLAKRYKSPDVSFSLDNVRGTTSEQLIEYEYRISQLVSTIGRMKKDYITNPWRSCRVPYLTHELRHDIQSTIKRLIPKMNMLVNIADQIVAKMGLDKEVSIKEIDHLIEICDILIKSTSVPISFLENDNHNYLQEQIIQYQKLSEDYKNIYQGLIKKYQPGYLYLPVDAIQNDFTNAMDVCLNSLYLSDEQEIIENIDTLIDFINKTVEIMITIKSANSQAENLLAIKKATTIDDSLKILQLVREILSNPKPVQDWFDVDKFQLVKDRFKDARKYFMDIDIKTKDILTKYDPEILQIDSIAMIRRFKTEYTNAFRIFNKSYRKDKKNIRSLLVDVKQKLSDSIIVQDLSILRDIALNKAWIHLNNEFMRSQFGEHYLGSYTDWNMFEKALQNFENIQQYFPNKNISQETSTVLFDVQKYDSTLKQIEGKIHSLSNSDIINQIKQIFIFAKDCKYLEIDLIHENAEYILKTLQLLAKSYSSMKQYSLNPISYHEVIDNFSKLSKIQAIQSQFEIDWEHLENQFSCLFHGVDTDWVGLAHAVEWTKNFRSITKNDHISETFIQFICTDSSAPQEMANFSQKVKNQLSEIETDIYWYSNLFDESEEILANSLRKLINRMIDGVENLYLLEEWLDFRTSRELCREIGLEGFIDSLTITTIEKTEVLNAFLKRFYRLWLDSVLPEFPAVRDFRKWSQEATINEFINLDKMQLSIARSRIVSQLAANLPDINKFTSSRDEVSILKREMNKQRRIMPLRKLFMTIPELLLTLKPCLMMSPLSVSLFLIADYYQFDLVVFDEASQVHTEDAIGAIFRGSQVIIVGDSKQLPPTSFFTATVGDHDYDDDSDEYYDDSDAYESILDEAASVLPKKTLHWHYRSRHENLIAFSNTKIYNNELITFPSHIDIERDYGVEYIFVEEGVYDRGGKRNNIPEAKRIAQLVFEHFNKYPRRSLGVVTFSEAQQQAIESTLWKLRLKNQQFEKFFSEEKEEAFFIKNLENVQGDERDTIIFSIGYAKDTNGVMYMNFGPLSRQEGYRRLNVAITRAKYNVKLVGSIHPTDIEIEKINSEGVKMLRSYIEYAINGKESLRSEINIPDIVNIESPFEESVYEFIRQHGYRVTTQVGCSGYRIDMAINHPSLDGRFVLGIECDGAMYHSAKTARERDRLRQSVLENMGWKIYRIWSTDWIKDQNSEGQKLLENINQAIQGYCQNNREDLFDDNKQMVDWLEVDESNIYKDEEKIRAGITNGQENSYGFNEYSECDTWKEEWEGASNSDKEENMIIGIIHHEAPIHLELLYRRAASFYGYTRASSRIRVSINRVIKRVLQNDNKIERRGDFFYIRDMKIFQVRVPKSDEPSRVIEHIAVEELAEAMRIIANGSFGITIDELEKCTARVFGFKRTGSNVHNAMQTTYQYLIKYGLIEEINGKINNSRLKSQK